MESNKDIELDPNGKEFRTHEVPYTNKPKVLKNWAKKEVQYFDIRIKEEKQDGTSEDLEI